MEQINGPSSALMFAGGAIGGPVGFWAVLTDQKIVENVMHRSPFSGGVTLTLLLVICWIILGFAPAGVAAFIAAVKGEPFDEDAIGILIWLWIFFGVFLIIAGLGTVFVAMAFHISAGMMLIAWLLAAILLTLIVIAFRAASRSSA